jgi:hypothetical protein
MLHAWYRDDHIGNDSWQCFKHSGKILVSLSHNDKINKGPLRLRGREARERMAKPGTSEEGLEGISLRKGVVLPRLSHTTLHRVKTSITLCLALARNMEQIELLKGNRPG